jgi:hypothetical protein
MRIEMGCPTVAAAFKLRPRAECSERGKRVLELRWNDASSRERNEQVSLHQDMNDTPANQPVTVNLDKVKDRLARLLEQADDLVNTRYHSESRQEFVDAAAFREWRVGCVVFLQEAFGVESAYTREYDFCCDSPYLSAVVRGRAVLRAVREYIAFGRVARVEELVASEIFNDLIAIARRMAERGNLHAALVAAGTVIEDVIRRSARNRKITFREDLDDAATINQKLWQGGVYPAMVAKRVANWLQLAQGAEGQGPLSADRDDVLAMLKGVSGFVSDYLV